MKMTVSREIRITDVFKPFLDTIEFFRDAVSFIIYAANEHYDEMKDLSSNDAMTYMERLIHSTARRKAKYPSFDKRFKKFPSYLRRSAIKSAIVAVMLYRKNLSDWDNSDKKRKKPKLVFNRNVMPAFYRENMFFLDEEDGTYSVRLKLLKNNDWVWHTFTISQADVRNVQKEFDLEKAMCPTLKKHGNRFSLSFAFEKEATLPDKNIKKDKKKILAVDIGINNPAVCVIMTPDGTVEGRKFIKFPEEEDRFGRILNERRKAHSISKCRTSRLDRFLRNYNEDLAMRTASEIVNYAYEHGCAVIVMEHLDMHRKLRGSKKERLHLWRKKDILKRVEELAHRKGMRISTVYARGTSKYAYDGSGIVERDPKNHSLCTFKTGKRYHADLSAAYNIGARYFIRDILKTLPETEASALKAKVPGLAARSTCTRSTLINLLAETASA